MAEMSNIEESISRIGGKGRYFVFDHLKEPQQAISKIFAEALHKLSLKELEYVDWSQVDRGLDKLLEARDCFVRASLPVEVSKHD